MERILYDLVWELKMTPADILNNFTMETLTKLLAARALQQDREKTSKAQAEAEHEAKMQRQRLMRGLT